MNSSKQIKTGAILSYVAIAINISAMLLYTPWMKNQIGMGNYGLYTLANSFISIFLLDFGIGSAVARFVAKYRAENNLVGINNLLGLVYKLYILIDIVVGLILFVVFFFLEEIYTGLTVSELNKFKILYIVISTFSLFSFPFTTLNGVFNAYEKFVLLKICDLFNKLFSILLVIIALINDFGVIAIVTANAFSGIITVGIKLILLKRELPVKANFKIRDKNLFKEIASFSIWTAILGIAQRLTYNIAPSILGIVANSYQIALYSPASAIAGYFYIFATAINGLFLPTISRKIAENKENDILALMISVGRFQVIVLGLLYVGFCVVGKEFMCTWMGTEFEPSYHCVLLLALPTIFEYSQQIANTTIIAKNKVSVQAIGLLATSLLNVIISPVLSTKYGVYGVSISIIITAFLNLIFMNVVYYKILKIDVFEFYKRCYLSIITPIIGGIIIASLLTVGIPFIGWKGIVIKGIITASVFLLLVLVFHIDKTEKQKIMLLIMKR